jgi:hypothetical protein
VETNDLYLAFQDTLGLSPDWFFDQWLYKGGEPHFKISTRVGAATSERGVSSTTLVDIEQIHPMDQLTGAFRMPVVIEVHYTDRTKDSIRVDITTQRSLVELPNPGKKTPSFILFDPGSYILKRVTFDRSWDARVAQMKYAPHMIDRFDAFETFRGDTARIQDRLDMIEDVMDRERFHAMRSEAVGQAIELSLVGNTHALKTVERGLKDPAVEVRSAAINGLTTIPVSLKGACERLLEDSSYAVIQSALTKLVQSFPSDSRTYLSKVKDVRGPHERVRITRLEAEASDGSSSALAELSDLCGPGWEFITRQNAMGAMRRLGTLTEEGARNILLAIVSTNSRLSGVAQTTLAALTEQPRWRSMVRRVAMGMQVEQWQRDMLIPYTR